MAKTSKTFIPIFYAIAAAALFTTANQPTAHPAVMIILNVAGAGCAGAAALEFVWLCLVRWIEARGELQRIACTSSESVLYSIIARMTPAQLAALEKSNPVWLIAGGSPAPSYSLQTLGGAVPMEAVREFFRRSPTLSIIPIRSYSEGSSDRRHTQLLTDLFIYHGFARVARGNQAAEWLTKDSRARAAQFIGLDLGELDHPEEV